MLIDPSSHAHSKRGFTLVELLVVIAIIGVLIGLLLPAVQAAREAARRSDCMNKCKQLGLALHSFHDANQQYPPAGYLKRVTTGKSVPEGGDARLYFTWLTLVLPSMEESALYDQIDMSQPIYGTSPQAIVSTQVKTLQCPSDRKLQLSQTHNMAYTNYAGSEGYHWWASANLNTGHDPSFTTGGDFSGVFTVTKQNSIADILDGTSKTVAIAEVSSLGFKNGPIRTCNTGIVRDNTGQRVARAAFVYTGHTGECCQTGKYEDANGSTSSGSRWIPKNNPHMYSPTFLTAWGPNANWPGASTAHPQTMSVVNADGSTKSMNINIDWASWAQQNGIADGYVVSQQ